MGAASAGRRTKHGHSAEERQAARAQTWCQHPPMPAATSVALYPCLQSWLQHRHARPAARLAAHHHGAVVAPAQQQQLLVKHELHSGSLGQLQGGRVAARGQSEREAGTTPLCMCRYTGRGGQPGHARAAHRNSCDGIKPGRKLAAQQRQAGAVSPACSILSSCMTCSAAWLKAHPSRDPAPYLMSLMSGEFSNSVMMSCSCLTMSPASTTDQHLPWSHMPRRVES